MSSEEIAQRLAAHPRWRRVAGMSLLSPVGWARVDDDRLDEWEGWPDLDDPATQGVLLAMLREAGRGETWADDAEFAAIAGRVLRANDPEFGEALALALLAAWGEDGGHG